MKTFFIITLLAGLISTQAQPTPTNQPTEASLLPRAQRGEMEAEYELAMLFAKKGAGTDEEIAKAIPWFIKAADQGHPHANLILGMFHESGKGVPKSETESARRNRKSEELYTAAADRGDLKAQTMLGDMYQFGWGVKADKATAQKWFTKAAEKGHPEAQCSLGAIYAGVDDFSNAAKWYQKAADGGDLKAQSNLGQLYLRGVGVPKDLAEGIKWTRRAAEKGHSTAQYNLGAAYRDGTGVDKDQKQADEWFAKAKRPR